MAQSVLQRKNKEHLQHAGVIVPEVQMYVEDAGCLGADRTEVD